MTLAAAAPAQEIYQAGRSGWWWASAPAGLPTFPRFIADKLGEALRQRVVVENKPGAAGMLATRDVLGQTRDGYHLLLCTHFEPINVGVYRNPQFKLSDLAPISLVAKYCYGPRWRTRSQRTTLRRSCNTPGPVRVR